MRLNKFLPAIAACILLSCTLVSKNSCAQQVSARPEATNLSFAGKWDEQQAKNIVVQLSKQWPLLYVHGKHSVNSSLAFRKNNVDKRFFQVLSHGESCRFCPGLVGVVVFSENNGFWGIEHEDNELVRLGSHGIPPEAEVIKLGFDHYGLLFQWMRHVQGGGYAHRVVLLDLGNDRYPIVLDEEIYQSETILVVKVISNETNSYFNIRINSKTYAFNNGKYRVSGVESLGIE